MMKSDELESFLREHGWKQVGVLPRRPAKVRFDVPFIPEVMRAHGSQNHLHQ
jgi:hypothetical protein